MYSPYHWSHDPYHHFKSASSPYPTHTYPPLNIPPYRDPRHYQPRPNPHRQAPKYSSKPRRSSTDIETSDFSSHSDFDADADTTLQSHLHPSFYPTEPAFHAMSHLKQVQIRVPKRTAQDLRGGEHILILPPNLTHLKISIHAQHARQIVRAAVVGEMRLRDVVKQVLPGEYLQDARAYVRLRGEWIEPGAGTKISDVVELGRAAMNERGEVEIKVMIGGGGRERERESGNGRGLGRHVHGWERERGEVERMRVF
ncbi:hypothetical protein CC86DRAFT_468778 [Ophiobolus disseminans]|uniref:Uncharacterized protein n=1 Tax=Ophiobolus disseminans TaxID=1469910 RepID=A0A6A6ZTV4_9PLEO|nr:hypothetical protein CC86DRAFT_468778 [Ophiobolus disseminans]